MYEDVTAGLPEAVAEVIEKNIDADQEYGLTEEQAVLKAERLLFESGYHHDGDRWTHASYVSPEAPDDFTVAKVDEAKRQVFGWAYTTHDPDGRLIVDRQGDFIDDPMVLEKAVQDYVMRSGLGDEMHRTIPVGKLIESMVVTPDKVQKLGIPQGVLPTGWWAGWQVTDDSVWDKVANGEYRMFSIGGRGRREKVA